MNNNKSERWNNNQGNVKTIILKQSLEITVKDEITIKEMNVKTGINNYIFSPENHTCFMVIVILPKNTENVQTWSRNETGKKHT